MCYAAHKGSKEVVKLLLDNGGNPELQTNFGDTPYSLAYEKGHTDVADLIDNAVAMVTNEGGGFYHTHLWMPWEGEGLVVEWVESGKKEWVTFVKCCSFASALKMTVNQFIAMATWNCS